MPKQPPLHETLIDYIIEDEYDLLESALQELDVNMSIVNNSCNPEKTTLLHLAIQHYSPEIIELLINKDCDIDAQDSNGQTALMLLCQKGNVELALRFIDAACNIDCEDHKGCTALSYAAEFCHEDIIRALLVAKGIDPDEVNQDAKSRAEMNRLDDYNYTLLMRACKYNFDRDDDEDQEEDCTPEIVRMLVNAGCEVNHVSQHSEGYRSTALIEAIYDQSEDVVHELIDLNADIHVTTTERTTPLMCAAGRNKRSIVRRLLREGCNVRWKNRNGSTALHLAADVEIIRMLIKAGSRVNSKCYNNKTPLMCSLSFGSDNNSVKKEVYALLLESGANINAVDKEGCTVLMHAMSGVCEIDAVQLLLDSGCADTINKKNKKGETALDLAVWRGQVDCVCMLLGVKDIEVDMRRCCRIAASPRYRWDKAKVKECAREVAAFVIQRQWRECYWNPKYLVCRKRLMEEGEEMERDIKRLRKEDDGSGGGSDE